MFGPETLQPCNVSTYSLPRVPRAPEATTNHGDLECIMKKLAPFTTILVHPGNSHNDEILATAIAIASQGNTVPVFRRDPTEDDLQNQEVLVLDQGGRIDNRANVFDHHQLPREAPAECTFTIIAKELGVDADLGAFFPWYRTWAEIDAHGPFAWAKINGFDWSKASSLLNPLDDMVHWMWERDDENGQVDPLLVDWIFEVGKKILATAERFQGFREEADYQESLSGYTVMEDGKTVPGRWVRGVKIFDLTWASADDALEFGDAYAKLKGESGGILVSMDNRGPGLALFRRNDDPRVDFSVLDGCDNVLFAHKGGFIAKTKEPAGWGPLVKAAVK